LLADDDKKTPAPKHDDDEENGEHDENGTIYTDKGLSDIIDYVLKTMDMNNDGYVDYPEYLTKSGDIGND